MHTNGFFGENKTFVILNPSDELSCMAKSAKFSSLFNDLSINLFFSTKITLTPDDIAIKLS